MNKKIFEKFLDGYSKMVNIIKYPDEIEVRTAFFTDKNGTKYEYFVLEGINDKN
jgi:hypothetical protein